MLIYLAHPIDQAQGASALNWLSSVLLDLNDAMLAQGHTYYRPGTAFAVAPGPQLDLEDATALDSINRNALYESCGLVAVLPPGVPTLGVPSEIEQALQLNRPTCIVTTAKMWGASVQITSWVNRGAQVMLASEVGRILDQNPLADVLASLPRPLAGLFAEMGVSDGPPPLLIARTSSAAKMPSRAYPGDAGLDLAVVGEHEIHPGEYKLLPTGVAAAVPDGYWGFMTGRSSAWTKFQFDVRTAVIDSGYRGELMIGVHNRGSECRTVFTGQRLAQYVLLPAFAGKVEEVAELPEHERGTNGYGSSGQ